jgi:hypothetical protein
MFILPHLKGLTAANLGSAAFKGADLDLKFAANKSLVDSISGNSLVSFTRAGSAANAATYVDSSGVLQRAVTNLLLRSEEFDDAAWTATNSTFSPNATIAPNGTLTADKHIPGSGIGIGTGASQTRVYQTPSFVSGLVYTFSIYAKQGEYDQIALAVLTSPSVSAIYSLTLGTVVPPVAGATIDNVGNGWYRCSLTFTATSTSAFQVRWSASSSTISFGDGVSGIFAWGAQLEQSSTVGEYVPTVAAINSAPRFDHNPTTGESLGLLVEEPRTNYLLQSQDFTTTWSQTNVTNTPNTTTSPDGSTNADTLVINTIAASTNQTTQSFTAGSTITASVFAKKNTSDFVRFELGSVCSCWFNLNTGATGSNGTGSGNVLFSTKSIQPFGNGWYRCVLTVTTTTITTLAVAIFATNADNTTSAVGSSIFLWGAEAEVGAFPTSYIPTTTATVTRAADVASITGSNFGTTRTNLVRNNTMVGAVAGSPGTPPTNGWVIVNNATYTSSILGTGVENGINYIDIQYVVAAAASAATLFYADTPAGSASTAYTGSYYFKLVSGTSPQVRFTWQDNVSTYNRTLFDLTSTLTRYTDTLTTAAGATLARLAVGIAASPSGATFVIRVGMPQVELGSVATAVIPTTTAAASVFESSWYNQAEGTVFVSGTAPVSLSFVYVSVDNGTTSERLQLRRTGNGVNPNYRVVAGGQSIDSATKSIGTPGGFSSQTLAYASNNYEGACNGTLEGLISIVNRPTATQLQIGNGPGSVTINGTIKRLTYWPVRLANTTLQQITQP